ncbi:hypothetical protein FOZ61_006657 [Perkinsus olseni]|uniref:Histone H2B n=1 Tax=Perkinsus olseni TaxID=32597 RepID=A0A7J6LMA7_PEROL|nr:hypothetical protein FOZ61_006657 [Perkinsus olseni]KAF4660415.1 hypothetical protein FOL46_006151 [Perkinsus olseni]
MAPKKKPAVVPAASPPTLPPAAAPMSETQGSGSPKKKGRKPGEKRRRRHAETYNTYIFRVLKQVHPNTGISKKSMMIMNSFVNDTFERIVSEAAKLCKYSTKGTLSSREIQTAIRLVLPGELAKHAVSEGTKSALEHERSRIGAAGGRDVASSKGPLEVTAEDRERIEALRARIGERTRELDEVKENILHLGRALEGERRAREEVELRPKQEKRFLGQFACLRQAVHETMESFSSFRKKRLARKAAVVSTAEETPTAARVILHVFYQKWNALVDQDPERPTQRQKQQLSDNTGRKAVTEAGCQTVSKRPGRKHGRRRRVESSESDTDGSSYSHHRRSRGRSSRQPPQPVVGYPPMVPFMIPYGVPPYPQWPYPPPPPAPSDGTGPAAEPQTKASEPAEAPVEEPHVEPTAELRPEYMEPAQDNRPLGADE